LLYVPKPYVVPGGRFREFYYWDAYFTMLGLIRDRHLDTARDLVDDFSYMLRTHALPVALAAPDVLPHGRAPLPRSGDRMVATPRGSRARVRLLDGRRCQSAPRQGAAQRRGDARRLSAQSILGCLRHTAR